ncbi:baseplate J/gp47 family protein [Gluconobacter morbifer]|uniref:Uncharacterized protein n=1 Tax=Gluconobacter morbifer G707 TaxID=1088869 RepID=G6XIR3_9PROT|nr:baseplate J/gp47 family protein [Gluconobacter morbifer]EHH68371.1 hypothetical protein GMO_11410 [Gluconobacter morbifer G707]
MPWSRPTLTDLIEQAKQDVSSANLPGVDGLLNLSVLFTLGYAVAGLSNLHYGYQDWIARQGTPWGATGEYADGWGSLKGVIRKAATSAVLSFQFSGTQGTVLPAGSSVTVSNNLIFSTNSDAIVSSSGMVTVEATASGTGADYNLSAGTSVSLSSPVSGISSTGSVVSIVTAGAAQETDDAYKTRYLKKYASSAGGGSATDYVDWAEAVTGVTRAWCNPYGFGAGTVVVYIMLDEANAAYNGFPQGTDGSATGETRYPVASGNQLAVANAIYNGQDGENDDEQPVTALVIVCAPLQRPIDFQFGELSSADDTTLGLIKEALADMMVQKGSPLGMTLYPSDWNEAIASVESLTNFYVSSPVEPIALPVGYLPVLGEVVLPS